MKHNSITNIYFFSWAETKLGISWCLFHHNPPPPPHPSRKPPLIPKKIRSLWVVPRKDGGCCNYASYANFHSRVSLPKPSPLEVILLGLKGFLLMSWWLSFLWACSTLDCVLSFWEETPVHFKGAADTQGVPRNKTLTLCLSSFHLSLNRHPFLLCK